MKNRFMGWIFGVVVLTFSGVGLAQAAQQAGAAGATAIPRTPDGKPDLSGTWVTRGSGGGTGWHLEGLTESMTRWGEVQHLWNTEPIVHQGYYEPIERQRMIARRHHRRGHAGKQAAAVMIDPTGLAVHERLGGHDASAQRRGDTLMTQADA